MVAVVRFLKGSLTMENARSPIEPARLIDRSAGILLHLTSLPGPVFTGDIGPSAKSFADFLWRCKQTVWQMLPIQPTTPEQGYSPYSSSSAIAANPLLISPDLLAQKKLIDAADVMNGNNNDMRADFNGARSYKEKLLDKAWLKWNETKTEESKKVFSVFCNNEGDWLHDYALYMVLKAKHGNRPWYDWPVKFRDRNIEALKQFESENAGELAKVKWIQMIFREQWHEFRSYCNDRSIRLFGDIPMYVAHDSADVWSNRNIFTLNPDGSMSEVAGVPPDLFNDEGQLWGMPLFRWDVLKASGYDWWIKRLKKNFEYFDMLRLDHFRGFASYWSVPANAKSAKEGKWKQGAGANLFEVIYQSLGNLPFVAEDLGEIDEPVYQLRDELNLPGMNVLQFAFSDDMPESNYLPHNHQVNSVVYTGTHDNNTTLGWYKSLLRSERKNLASYMGIKISEKNISEQMCRLAYMSVSMLAVLPMQDILSLDESARMNMPATIEGNWTWRLDNKYLAASIEKKLNNWTFYFARQPNMRKTGI